MSDFQVKIEKAPLSDNVFYVTLSNNDLGVNLTLTREQVERIAFEAESALPREEDWFEDGPDGYDDDDGLTDSQADAMTLSSAGWGTDEDYGYAGDDYY